jgi:hypothetical protein
MKFRLKSLEAVGDQRRQNATHSSSAQGQTRSVERFRRDGTLKVHTGETVHLQIKQTSGRNWVHHEKTAPNKWPLRPGSNSENLGSLYFLLKSILWFVHSPPEGVEPGIPYLCLGAGAVLSVLKRLVTFPEAYP